MCSNILTFTILFGRGYKYNMLYAKNIKYPYMTRVCVLLQPGVDLADILSSNSEVQANIAIFLIDLGSEVVTTVQTCN